MMIRPTAALVALAVLAAACTDDGAAGPDTSAPSVTIATGASEPVASRAAPTTSRRTTPPTTSPSGAETSAPATTVAPLAPASFTIQPGTEQVAVLDAEPGSDLDLRDGDEQIVGRGTVDEAGSLLWRDVVPGEGYLIRSATEESEPFAVAAPEDHPGPELYTNQPLLPPGGFGYVTVRDGTTLSANVVLPGPVEAGPYPTVVEYSGYDPSNPANATFAQIFNAMGFAYVGVNMRGTGCSGGSYRFFETVQNLDGYDVVEAVAAQPWVEFNTVGMVGISYPGIAQLFVAQTQPPHLAAITPLSVLDDSFRATLYPGGILNTGFAVEWTSQRVEEAAPFGQDWARERADGGDARCAENQELRLQNPDLVDEIDATPYYEESLGDSLAPITFVDRIEVPVFLAGAWQDEQTGGHFPRMLDRFTSSPRLDVTLMNGLHTESLSPPVFGRLAEFLQLYVARDVPTMAAANAVAPILSNTLFGIDQVEPFPERFAGMSYEQSRAVFEAEPAVRILLEQGGAPGFPAGAPQPLQVATYPAWPVPAATERAWFLGDGGRLTDSPVADGEASYTADPDALPDTFYEGDGSGIWRAGTSYDWRPLPGDAGLGFVTEPLDRDLTILGGGVVELELAADAPDTDLEVTLSEVRPDDTEIYIQSGWLRASQRALDQAASTELQPVPTFTEEDVEPLTPGEITDVAVPLFPVAHPLRAGSRLRLTIDAPGNNRAIWEFRTISDGEEVTVSFGPAHASRLALPVVDDIALAPRTASLRIAPRSAVPTVRPGRQRRLTSTRRLIRRRADRYPRSMSGDSDRATTGTATEAVAPAWLRSLVREISDFPTPGVQFRDITPLLADGQAFHRAVEELAGRFGDERVDRVVGVEARGFILAAPLAYRLQASFIPVRKAGKLPWAVVREEYLLEYGVDKLELHRDAIHPDDRVLIIDDVLATGGTASATMKLVETLGGLIVGFGALLEVVGLGGRDALAPKRVEVLASY